MINAEMATLEEAGFTFPECFGKSRHPFLDDAGQTRDPRLIGFAPCTLGGGSPALSFELGRFCITLIGGDGCGIPATEEWQDALVNVDVDRYEANGYDLICMTGQEWKKMCS